MLGWLKDRFRRGPVVPVVRLSGVIASSGLLSGRSLSVESVSPLLKRAFETRGAKAVALAINSPGGSPAQSALIAQRIRLLAEEKSLKVIAFVEDVAASGGYWLACAADEIIVDANSIVGSIGVISAGFGFKDWVRQRRAGRLKDDEATLFTGEFWTGRRGLQLGLADGLGELRTTLQARYGTKVHLPVIAQRRRLLSRFGLGSAVDGIGIGPSTLAALEERLHWQRFGL
jgi:ClpP class serine protease